MALCHRASRNTSAGYDRKTRLGNLLISRLLASLPVTATISEPLTCWTNNIYGATGVFVGSGIGFLRTLYCDPNCKAEIIPADRCINGLIAVPLHIQKNWYISYLSQPLFVSSLPLNNELDRIFSVGITQRLKNVSLAIRFSILPRIRITSWRGIT